MLKQPLETAVAIHTEDFEDFHVQEGVHIVISVKDFKAIVTHAETLRGSITAQFSAPSKPLQFSYQSSGIHCEFTLMTSGDTRSGSTESSANFISTRTGSHQSSAVPAQASSRSASDMPPPPARPAQSKTLGSQTQKPSLGVQGKKQPPIEPEQDSDSLFIPAGDDDQTWAPRNFDNEEDEEMLGWDASNERPDASFHATFRDSRTAAPTQVEQRGLPDFGSQDGLEPTQRLSQVSPPDPRLVCKANVCLASWHVRLSHIIGRLIFDLNRLSHRPR